MFSSLVLASRRMCFGPYPLEHVDDAAPGEETIATAVVSPQALADTLGGPSLSVAAALSAVRDAALLNRVLFPRPHASFGDGGRPVPSPFSPNAPHLIWLGPNAETCVMLYPHTKTPPAGALLYFHGNACDTGQMVDYRPIFDVAQRLRLHVLLVEYPGYGPCVGLPNESTLALAAARAWDACISLLDVPPRRILLYGTSIGTAVAVDLAARSVLHAGISAAPWGLLLEAPLTSVRRVAVAIVPPAAVLMQDRFNSLARLPQAGTVPVFCVHGTEDTLIAPEHAHELVAASRAGPRRRLVLVNGGNHNYLPGDWPTRAARFFAATADGTDARVEVGSKLAEDVRSEVSGSSPRAPEPLPAWHEGVPLPPRLDLTALAQRLPPAPSPAELETRLLAQRAAVKANARALERLSGMVDSVAGAASRFVGWFHRGV